MGWCCGLGHAFDEIKKIKIFQIKLGFLNYYPYICNMQNKMIKRITETYVWWIQGVEVRMQPDPLYDNVFRGNKEVDNTSYRMTIMDVGTNGRKKNKKTYKTLVQ